MNKKLLKSLQGSSIQMERKVPGTYLVEGREIRYVSNRNKLKFDKIFDQLFDADFFPIPKSGGVITEGCKITLPNNEIFEAVSYKGDIEGWRQLLEQRAKAINEKLARIDIDTESIVLNDMRAFRLTDCKIDFY